MSNEQFTNPRRSSRIFEDEVERHGHDLECQRRDRSVRAMGLLARDDSEEPFFFVTPEECLAHRFHQQGYVAQSSEEFRKEWLPQPDSVLRDLLSVRARIVIMRPDPTESPTAAEAQRELTMALFVRGARVHEVECLAEEEDADSLEELARRANVWVPFDSPRPITRTANTVEAERVKPLWPGRIPLGSLTVLGGDPGQGKTAVACDIVARVTQALTWPDDRESEVSGDAIIVNLEDDPGTSLRPRLEAAGADLRKVHLLDRVELRGRRVSINLKDLSWLELILYEHPRTRLIILDPIGSFLGGKDSYKDAEVRDLLVPLQELARRRDVAILLVAHLNKASGSAARHRILGSVAFSGVPRTVLFVTADPSDEARRLLVPVKDNWGAEKGGLRFLLDRDADHEAPRVRWKGRTDQTVDDVLASLEKQRTDQRRRSSLSDEDLVAASAYLEENHPVPTREAQEWADSRGIPRAAMDTAAKELGMRKRPGGFQQPWLWTRPAPMPGCEGHRSESA